VTVDTRRWILAEAWLSLGLRMRWAPEYMRRETTSEWLDDAETRGHYLYDGHGEWLVLASDRGLTFGANPGSPYLGVETMRHELAHYLMASAERRTQRNFGLRTTDRDTAEEERALLAEQAFDAVLAGAARIADLALSGDRRKP
jgi:hypothetical protein